MTEIVLAPQDRKEPSLDGWSLVKLEDVVDVLDSQRIPVNAKEREKRQGDVPYYGATGQVGWIDDYLFNEELILLGEDGAPFLDSGKQKAYLIRGKTWVNNHAHVLRARNGIPSAYIKYYLDIVDYHEFVTGTTRPKLNQAAMRKIPIPIAPPDQQELIVAEIEKQFSRLDEAVAGLKRIKANLKRYKAAVLKAAVEGKLTEEWRKAHPNIESGAELLKRILAERKRKWEEKNPGKKCKEPVGPDISNLPELPKGWVWASTEQLTWYITSGSRDWKQYYSDKGALFIRTQDINRNTLDLNEVAYVNLPPKVEGKRSLVELNDILVIITGANVGKVALVERNLPEAYVSQSVGLMKFANKNIMRYIHLAMIAEGAGRLQLEKMVYGMGRPVLSLENLRDIILPLPPEKEQRQIVEKVEERFSVLIEIETVLKSNLKRADRLRQGILKKAFSGKLVSQDGKLYRPVEISELPMAAESTTPYGKP